MSVEWMWHRPAARSETALWHAVAVSGYAPLCGELVSAAEMYERTPVVYAPDWPKKVCPNCYTTFGARPERSATKWDHRMLEEARLAASFSKDPSTKVGAVIANGRRIVSKGFNGFAQGMNDAPELYADRGSKYSRVIHAEMNALIFAERSVAGFTLYTVPFAPCDRCCVVLLQAGIRRFVFPKLPPELESRWLTAVNLSKSYMEEVGATWVEV